MTDKEKRITKFLLHKWRKDTQNLTNNLSKRRLRLLYGSLNKLSKSDRQFLSDKYYRLDANKPFSDETMAQKYEISKKEYVKRRLDIESKLGAIVAETEKQTKLQEEKER